MVITAVSRIIDIEAERYKLEPGARAVSEYDMPDHPCSIAIMPTDHSHSVYMEMALQLCGFLSPTLALRCPFPNLDSSSQSGWQGTLYSDVDLSGKTITKYGADALRQSRWRHYPSKFSFQLDWRAT